MVYVKVVPSANCLFLILNSIFIHYTDIGSLRSEIFVRKKLEEATIPAVLLNFHHNFIAFFQNSLDFIPVR